MDLMDTILGQTLNKYRTLKTEYLWRKVFNDHTFREWTLDLIRQDQLFDKGIDGDGIIIGLYSEVTEMINPSKEAGTPYTLFDTGEFYKSFILYVYNNYIEIDADPIKIDKNGDQDNLFKKYGENIIKLSQSNLEKFIIEFKWRFQRELRQLLQLY